MATRAQDPGPHRLSGNRWTPAVRERASDLLADLLGDVPRVARALREELGADVPHPTLKRWRDEAHRSNAVPSVAGISDRALRLLAGEMTRLEALPSSKLDLERLGKVASTLKTLDGLTRSSRSAPRARTLADLNGAEMPGAEAVPSS
jgi:hypothetical protein